MESPNLNQRRPEDDDLDVQLRTHFFAPPLADDGFSQRVLTALPAPQQKSLQFKRRLVCAVGSAAGVAAAAIGFIKSEDFEPALTALDHTLTLAFGQLVTGPVVLALGLAILSLAFAFRDQRRLLPRL